MAHFPSLFVTDLDGTALGGGYEPYARFPDPFSKFLDALTERNCKWAINTTWDIHGQWQLVLASSVKTKPAFLMGELGHRLAEIKDNAPELVQPYTRNMEIKVKEIREKRLFPLIKDICGKFDAAIIHFYGHFFDFIPDEKDLPDFNTYIIENYRSDDEILCSCNNRLVAYPAFLNKGNALREALHITRLTPFDVVAAGDETADIAMMQPDIAAYLICPVNAADEVKKHVADMNGVIGEGHSSKGIIDAFCKLAGKNNWDFPASTEFQNTQSSNE